MAIIRVLRVLEYIGEELDIWEILRKGGVPANGEVDHRHGERKSRGIMIKSALVGFPDLVFEEMTMTIDARYSMRGYFYLDKEGAYVTCRMYSGPLGYGIHNGNLQFPITEWSKAKEVLKAVTWYEDE